MLKITHFRVVSFFMLLAILAVLSIPYLDVQLHAHTQVRQLNISYQHTGLTPLSIEAKYTAPLENIIASLEGVEDIHSRSYHNKGFIQVDLKKHTDFSYFRYLLSQKLKAWFLMQDQQTSFPEINDRHISEEDQPLLIYELQLLNDTFPISSLKEQFEHDLRQCKQVGSLSWQAALEDVIHISYSLEDLAYYQLSLQHLQSSLRAFLTSKNVGLHLSQDGEKYAIQIPLQSVDKEALLHLKIPIPNTNQSVFLYQVANVYVGPLEERSISRVNGKTHLRCFVYSKKGANRWLLADEVKAKVARMSQASSDLWRARVEQDASEYLKAELVKVQSRALWAVGILMVLVILSYRSLSYLIVLVMSILMNLLLSILVIYLFEIQVHLYTIAAATISFGLMIDNVIVMLSHFRVYKEKSIISALFFAVMTTLAPLSLLVFLPDTLRMELGDFAVVVTLMLLVSLLVAYFFAPALYQLLTPNHPSIKQKRTSSKRKLLRRLQLYTALIRFITRKRKLVYVCLILMIGLPFFMLPPKIEGYDWYNKTIGSINYQKYIRPYVETYLGGLSNYFYYNAIQGKSWSNVNKRTKVRCAIQLEEGVKLEDMDYLCRFVERYISSFDQVDYFLTKINSGSYAYIEVYFKKAYENHVFPVQLYSGLIDLSRKWSAASWSIVGEGAAFDNQARQTRPFQLQLKGYDYDGLEELAQKVKKRLEENNRVKELNLNSTSYFEGANRRQWYYHLNYPLFSTYDYGIQALSQRLTLRPLYEQYGGILLWNTHQKAWYLEPQQKQWRKYDLLKQPIDIVNNSRLTLGNVGSFELKNEKPYVSRENRLYVRTISFLYAGGHMYATRLVKNTAAWVNQIAAAGYSAKPLSFVLNISESSSSFWILLWIIPMIYGLCAMLFESLRWPFWVLWSIAVSAIGYLWAYPFFEVRFDQGGYIAFVLLSGLSVNASIFILHDFMKVRQYKVSEMAIAKLLYYKSFPIIQTVLSTVVAMLPFIIEQGGQSFWLSLATGTIGGLVASLFYIFLVLPLFMYQYLQKK